MPKHQPAPLLVVQASVDYARRVSAHCRDVVFLATPERAQELLSAGFRALAADLSEARSALAIAANYGLSQRLYYAGIICFVCEHLPLTALLAAGLGLPFASVKSTRAMRDKAQSTHLWQRAGLAVPTSQLVASQRDLDEFSAAHPAPWILKPIDGTGSEWVLKIDEHAQLPAAHQRIQSGLLAAQPRDVAPNYLAQQYLRGREFGVDFFIDGRRLRVLRLCEKYLVEAPGQAGQVGAYYFPRLSQRLRRLIQETLLRAAQALDLGRGLAMADLVLVGDTVYLLEMAPRPGGDCLPDLCRAALAYDPIATACDVARGIAPRAHWPRPHQLLCALHLMSPRDGRIERLDFSPLLAHPSLFKLIEAYCEPGESLRSWDGSYEDRIVASCLAHYDNPSDLPHLWSELSALVHIEFAAAKETHYT